MPLRYTYDYTLLAGMHNWFVVLFFRHLAVFVVLRKYGPEFFYTFGKTFILWRLPPVPSPGFPLKHPAAAK